MTQVGNTSAMEVEDSARLALRNATNKDTTNKLRNATVERDFLQELLQRAAAAYSETELQGLLSTCEFQVLTHADNGNPDIVEVPLEVLGRSTEVRQLNYAHVQDLVMSDEHMWPPLEVCLWPDSKEKQEETVLLRIISGNHRTSAAKEKGLSSLPVRIFKAEREIDFRVLAIRSNASHGLNFTEDECKKQAAYLKQEGKTLDVIASILNKSKSTISRWLSGADSNASRKIAKIAQPQSTEAPAVKTPIRVVPTVAQKIEALLICENMSVSVQEAREYIDAMPAQKQQRVRTLFAWMQEAMEE
jgi:transcriptional regulator with XRE-family HTH domain